MRTQPFSVVGSALPEAEGDFGMTIGCDKSLCILPFAHRGSFQTKMFGWTGPLRAEQIVEIPYAKQVIYESSKAAVARGVPKDKAGIRVDEQFGAAILRDAAAQVYHRLPCRKERTGGARLSIRRRFRPTHRKASAKF
jgi:hypothetical protein